MAAVAPLTTPTRQPFGSISETRLRNLGNVKNKQNALSAPSSKSSILKTSKPQIFDDIDSENIDPAIFSTSTKSSKSLQSHTTIKSSSSSSSDMQHFRLASSILSKAPAARMLLASAAGQKRKASEVADSTPASADRPIKAFCNKRDAPIFTSLKPIITAPTAPAPAPAGRSPKSKRTGILSRRRVSARVDPPSGAKNYGLPSIDAALSGTLRSYSSKPTPSILDQMPKGWRFKIHEEPEIEQDTVVMQYSAGTLDLSSDDESRAKARDGRGKENIPPVDGLNAPIRSYTATSPSRNDMMTDDTRSALGVLNAADYYAPGYDANSYFIVPAEGSADSVVEKSNVNLGVVGHSNLANTAKVVAEPAAIATYNTATLPDESDAAAADDSAFDIWESGSAKAEDQAVS